MCALQVPSAHVQDCFALQAYTLAGIYRVGSIGIVVCVIFACFPVARVYTFEVAINCCSFSLSHV